MLACRDIIALKLTKSGIAEALQTIVVLDAKGLLDLARRLSDGHKRGMVRS